MINTYPISNEFFKTILSDPRGISFTFSEHNIENIELDLTYYKTIPFLVKSSSRFYLKPDIGVGI